MKKMHYYVYFSSNGYKYRVGDIIFNRKSELKNEFYRKKTYYTSLEKAQAVADKMNSNKNSLTNTADYKLSKFLNETASKIYEWKIEHEAELGSGLCSIVSGLYDMFKGIEDNIAHTAYEKYSQKDDTKK